MSCNEPAQNLNNLMMRPENQKCIDCGGKKPIWASLILPPPDAPQKSPRLGAFCCIRCSGVHRSLGTHICFVRSISLDEWREEEVRVMRNGGNQAINSVFEARYLGEPKKPGPQADIQTRERFIRAKYIDRKFYSENAYLNVKSHADKEYLPPSEVRSKSSSRLQRLSSLPTKLSVPPIERMPASCSEKPNNNSHTFTKPQDQVTDSVHGHVDTSESLDKNKLNYRDQQSKLFNQAQLIKLASPKANFASDDPSENIKNRFLDYMSQPIKLSPNSKFVACSDSGDNAKGLLRTWSDSPSAPEASVKDTRVDVPNSLNQRFHTFRVHKDVETSLKQTKNDAPNSLNETFRNFRVSGEISPILEGSHDLNNSWLSQKPWSFWM